ncbi:MAG: DUF2312 domain-containing protein [Rhodobacter sp.]|nr:DUF2312 domain-containing protein [Rhodobacter sp.]
MNEKTNINGILRETIERFESLEEEKTEITNQQKAVLADAVAGGLNGKAIRAIVALRKRQPDELAAWDSVIGLYREALDMPVGDAP